MFSIIVLCFIAVLPNCIHGFYKPNCEATGLSCLDCYSQKQCLNFFGLVHWSTVICGSSLTGEANIYCDPSTDKCSSVKPEGCAAISRYTCIRDGLLPNLNDCTIYHQCSDLSAEDFSCKDMYVYKQEYGKCILKLSDDDCVTLLSCGLQDYIEVYPADSSIYYGCIISKFFIKACKETETYNLNTNACESRCTSIGNVPNTRNCATYYQCVASDTDKLKALEISCPEGQGYNPSTNKCDVRYLNICNELYLLENDMYDLITFTPVLEAILQPIKTVLNYFNISPVNIIFVFGLDDQTLSDGILAIDYIYKNKRLPSTTIGIIVDIILPYLPSSVQSTINTLMKLGVFNARSVITSNNRGSDDLKNYLISILSDATIDLPKIINSFQGKNQEEVSKMIFVEAMYILKIPENQVRFIAMMLQSNMPVIANLLNEKLGTNLFVGNKAILKLNHQVVDLLIFKHLDIIALKMYPNNLLLARIFKMIAAHKYVANHGLIYKFVNNFYFTASNLI